MKKLLLIALITPSIALAHDGTLEGAVGECSVQVPGLDCSEHPEACSFVAKETTPEWRTCHDTYWECVGSLRLRQQAYNQCVGSATDLARLLEKKHLPFKVNQTVIDYPYPQHPIEGLLANDLFNCQISHLAACALTHIQFNDEIDKCEKARGAMYRQLKRVLK